ncbi:ricin-type beta-trefoil lectin domain protein [Kitasatospora sp. NPDC051853]|uniref:ricin-type beta-trefoil lectin domain protein n=1 Tax=Kitasatospora sp. NPDC051853 TaxID=3364058 RepID=UPI0037976023
MGERVRAPRRFGGGRFAVVAALAAVLVGGLAVPSAQAEGPSGPAVAAGGDLTGDGRVDVVSVTHELWVVPAGGAPYAAATAEQSPEGVRWDGYQVTRRGSATGTGTDDLYVFGQASHTLYLYPNDANSGGRPGYFTKKDRAVRVAKPQSCAAGTDCTGYDATWGSTTQVVATDGILNSEGVPDLVTVENGTLWYYPGRAGGAVIGAPVKLGSGDWRDVTVMAPGRVGGVPVLWARLGLYQPVLAAYRLAPGTDGLLRSPADTFVLQNGERDASGAGQCFSMEAGGVAPCSPTTRGWQFYADGTLRQGENCLAGGEVLANVSCVKQDARVWKPVDGGGLANGDGACLTLRSGTVVLEPCDGSARQRWGVRNTDPAADPLPLPAPLDVVTLPGDVHFTGYAREFTSPGDLDGDGNPELATLGDPLVVYRGAAPIAGRAGFGEQVSYGRPDQKRTTVSWSSPVDASDVLYSACASLRVDQGGSLVVTELASGRVLWSSNTPGRVGGRIVMPFEGGLQLRDVRGTTYWSAPVNGSHLTVQDDCNVVLRGGGGTALWSTRTYDPAHETDGALLLTGRSLKGGEQLTTGTTALTMGVDGNLVLTERQSARVLWTSGTEGHPGAVVALEADGNLVIRDAAGAPLRDSGTWGTEGTRLLVRKDGGLTLYDADSKALWSTGTRLGEDLEGTVVPSGRTLRSGETVESKAGRLVMQPDGNLVLYSKATGNSRWHSGTWGNEGATVTMQSDGNLVVRAADGRALWSTGTWTHRNARLVLRDDLDLLVLATDGSRPWATGTGKDAGAGRGVVLRATTVLSGGQAALEGMSGTALTMQEDGNLVLTRAGRVLWASGTWGNPGAWVTVQSDGNVVLYAGGRVLWSTGTWGHPGAHLVVQGDGNLVLYDVDSAPLWASGTQR